MLSEFQSHGKETLDTDKAGLGVGRFWLLKLFVTVVVRA